MKATYIDLINRFWAENRGIALPLSSQRSQCRKVGNADSRSHRDNLRDAWAEQVEYTSGP